MGGWLYGLAVIGAAALALGGLWMWRRDRRRSLLLLLAAAVTLFNVWSWSTLPTGRPGPPAPAGVAQTPPG